VPARRVWSNNSVRMTARNVGASTLEISGTPLAVLVMSWPMP
jgi:hypothetical protein